jgi:capsular polysaccharide biosynthesis protein
MPHGSIFIFDSSYPCADVAMPIDDTQLHVVVSDRVIEAPPGHTNLKLEEFTSFTAFRKNLGRLRAAWRRTNGRKCVVFAAYGVRREQILLNALYAVCLGGDVAFFDGMVSKPLARSGLLLLRSVASVLTKRTFDRFKLEIKARQVRRRTKSHPHATTPEVRLFGVYDRTRSFSLPLDTVNHERDGCSIYGDYMRGWYLPTLSNRRQRFTVETTRHDLRDVILHVEDVGGTADRFLFKHGRMLDYPYFLGRVRQNARYTISARNEVKHIERGIDLLHFTRGYYHWLVEGVPRILDLIDDGIDFDRYPLIMPPMEAYHRQVLEVLGISPDKEVIAVGKGDWCHVGECIVPTANFPFAAPGLDDPSGQPDGYLLRRIRYRILERLAKPSGENANASRRLYISRAKALRRKLTIQNEADVRSILESRGFRTVFLEELPWAEQVMLVSGAEFIVGLHGAGLANILFAKAASLVEFQNPLEARAHFAVMARELNIRYAYIVGKLDGRSNSFDNISIDLEVLKDMLRRLNLLS